jgi:two-component system, response regulator PdtaR
VTDDAVNPQPVPDHEPGAGAAAAAAPDAQTPSSAPTARTRIVVAEDETLIRLDLAEMLEEDGYEVVGQAANGEQAIELARELRPDLVVMDVKMPVLDGISDAGVMAYVVKPFTASDLVPAIDIARSRWVELHALETEIADLGERLETRKAVDRAKGVLMAQLSITEAEAFRWIQKTAMDRRLGMREVAEAVITGMPARTSAD